MGKKLYIDVYFAVNFVCDLLLLCITARILHLKTMLWRTVLASAAGALYACLAAVYGRFFDSVPARSAVPIIMIILSFGMSGKKVFIKSILVFAGGTFLFGGIFGLIFSELSGKIPTAVFFLMCFAASFFTLYFFDVFSFGTDVTSVKAEIVSESGRAALSLLCDSGNLLREPISGMPVILIGKRSFEKLCPQKVLSDKSFAVSYGIRLVPMTTANGKSVIYAFMPKKLTVEYKNKKHICRAMIGCARNDSFSGFDGVFPKSLL